MAIEKKPDGLVFASSAKLGEVVQFPDIVRGWGIAFEQTNGIPSMEHFNHLFNRIDSSLVYILQQGIPEWNENIDYPKGAIVKHGENIYKALSSNKNKEVSLSQYWIDTDSSFNVIRDMLIGVPIPHPLSTVPTGCLSMNGQRFDKSRYPKLALKYPSGTLPDMRGEFIRGWDNGRNVDVDRALLSSQEDAMQAIKGAVGNLQFIDSALYGSSGALATAQSTRAVNLTQFYSVSQNAGEGTGRIELDSSKVSRTAKETRPRNIAYHYICLAE